MERKLVYTVQEAARMIGVGKNTIYAPEFFDAWFQEQCANHAVIEL